MIWIVIGLVLGFAIGHNIKSKDTTDYSKIDAKLRDDLKVAQNLNESLLKDKNDLQEKLWKLKK